MKNRITARQSGIKGKHGLPGQCYARWPAASVRRLLLAHDDQLEIHAALLLKMYKELVKPEYDVRMRDPDKTPPVPAATIRMDNPYFGTPLRQGPAGFPEQARGPVYYILFLGMLMIPAEMTSIPLLMIVSRPRLVNTYTRRSVRRGGYQHRTPADYLYHLQHEVFCISYPLLYNKPGTSPEN
jgi:hypothetical protein